ncbi:MAG: dUTP diphosphatase [Agarilytica sp.]
MKQQLLTMLELQDAMNAKVNQDWRERQHEWYRAIWVECAELMDHHGWKWWKKQEIDREQVLLELVDIWHFGLSDLLMTEEGAEQCASLIESKLNLNVEVDDFLDSVETFACATLNQRHFDIAGFAQLMAGIDFGFDELYGRYVGKNVLNFFRQDHGYKDGSYQKIWQGKEDNEHLVELVESLDHSAEDFKDQLYAGLKSRYPSS